MKVVTQLQNSARRWNRPSLRRWSWPAPVPTRRKSRSPNRPASASVPASARWKTSSSTAMARWASPCITVSAKAAPLPPISAHRRTVQAALDIARYTSEDPCAARRERSAGVRGAGSRSVPPDRAGRRSRHRAGGARRRGFAGGGQAHHQHRRRRLQQPLRHQGVRQQPRHAAKLLFQPPLAVQLRHCGAGRRYGRDYAYTIGRAMGDLQSPEWVGRECARRTRASRRANCRP